MSLKHEWGEHFNPRSAMGSKTTAPRCIGGKTCQQLQMRGKEMSRVKVPEWLNLAQSCPFFGEHHRRWPALLTFHGYKSSAPAQINPSPSLVLRIRTLLSQVLHREKIMQCDQEYSSYNHEWPISSQWALPSSFLSKGEKMNQTPISPDPIVCMCEWYSGPVKLCNSVYVILTRGNYQSIPLFTG